jgi:hypothetical protein
MWDVPPSRPFVAKIEETHIVAGLPLIGKGLRRLRQPGVGPRDRWRAFAFPEAELLNQPNQLARLTKEKCGI